MNSPLFFLAFSLFSSLSSAHRLDIPLDQHLPTNPIKSSSVDDDAADPKIRLPTEPLHAPHLTRFPHSNHLLQLDFDLSDFLTKPPVHLGNRVGVPFIHYLPRRCRNHHNHFLSRHPGRFGPGIQVVDPLDDLASLFKNNAQVIHHRHVSRRFPEGGDRMPEFEQSFIPLHRVHRDVDPTVEVKTEYENHHLHHEHDHHVREEAEMKRDNVEEHHDHDEEKHADQKDDIVNKIRKFLLNF